MNEIYLSGLSLLTPLGADPGMVKTAIDVGMSSYQECAILGEGEPLIKFSAVPAGALKVHIPASLPGMSPPQIRLLSLAAFALADLQPQLPKVPLPLFLAGPEPYYSPGTINQAFARRLAKATGVNLDIGSSRYIATGRSGSIEAIATAFKYFAATGAHYALVGGVDTFYDIRTLGILEEAKRLSGNDSFDGFVPGEGAAFLLLASPYAPESVLKNSLLKLHLPAIVHEPGHLLGDAPYTAEVLADAFKRALTTMEMPISNVYSSENGEMHYTKELGVATIRHHHRLSSNRTIYRPAECFGDIGAAFAPVAIGLASIDIKKYSSSATLVYASSDGGPRAAICLSAV